MVASVNIFFNNSSSLLIGFNITSSKSLKSKLLEFCKPPRINSSFSSSRSTLSLEVSSSIATIFLISASVGISVLIFPLFNVTEISLSPPIVDNISRSFSGDVISRRLLNSITRLWECSLKISVTFKKSKWEDETN